jgi:DNA repair photolyase
MMPKKNIFKNVEKYFGGKKKIVIFVSSITIEMKNL